MDTFRMAMCATVVLLLMLIGCRGQTSDNTPQQGDGAAKKQYEISGQVVAVDPDGKKVTLDHEDIPGLMKGMEMEFSVENPTILRGVEVGDRVQGRLATKEGNYIITELKRRER